MQFSTGQGLLLVAGLVLVVALALASVAYGSAIIPLADVLRALAHAVGMGDQATSTPIERIIVDLRLPRVLLAVCVGAGLGIVGAMLQTVTRNDLADPFLFGLSSGAAAGAVSVITVLGDRFGIWTLPIAAFSGGMLAAVSVLLLVRRVQGQGPERLILAGLSVSFLFAALTNYMVFSGDQRAAHSVLFWTLGGLGLARWDNLPLAMLGLAAILIYALANHRNLDAFLAGEHTRGKSRRARYAHPQHGLHRLRVLNRDLRFGRRRDRLCRTDDSAYCAPFRRAAACAPHHHLRTARRRAYPAE